MGKFEKLHFYKHTIIHDSIFFFWKVTLKNSCILGKKSRIYLDDTINV